MKQFLLMFFVLGSLYGEEPWSVSNEAYTLVAQEDGEIGMKLSSGETATLQPHFTVLYSPKAPGYDYNNSNYPLAPRWALRWANYEQPLAELNQWLTEEMGLDVTVTEDAKGQREWQYHNAGGMPARRYVTEDGGWKITGRYAKGTTNPFLAGQRTDLVPSRVDFGRREVVWTFEPHDDFKFSARLTLPEGDGPPDNRSERSLVTELPDAPEHPIWKLTYSSFNPGHAWEFVGAMIDFFVQRLPGPIGRGDSVSAVEYGG